jgi:hypothetical protein
MSRIIKTFIVTVTALTLLLAVTGLVLINVRELPDLYVKEARRAVSDAKHVKAHVFCNSLKYFTQAETLYDSAMYQWRSENRKFIFLRNYEQTILFADSSLCMAKLAREQAIKGSAELKQDLINEIIVLKRETEFYEPFIRKLPLPDSVLNNQSRGKLLLTEAEITYSAQEYINSGDLLSESRQLLLPTHLYIEDLLSEYFLRFSQWKDLAMKLVEDSKIKQRYTVLVDKFARQCILYYNGKPRYTFPVELGENWIDDKRFRGDKATPEGLYKIIDKKEGRYTNYYKALLLNYPNDEDIAQYEEALRRGMIRRSTHIGGHIEIHGNGGKGIDWTEGCIAVSNSDMDQIYKLCRSGTPVAIVGSLKPLHEILR